MDKKYMVQRVDHTEGIERLRDPIPRRLYRGGDVIELDALREPVKQFLDSGLIVSLEPDPEPEPKKTKGVTDGNNSSG